MKAGLALGSNVGDRLAQLQAARDFLAELAAGSFLLQSPVYETEPVDCPPGSQPYLNAVVEIDWAGDPRALFSQTARYEREHGRDRRGGINAPRTIDLDLLYGDDRAITDPDLVIPHPRLAQRRFVLEPLAAIRPDLVLPGQTRTVAQLLAGLPAGREQVRLMWHDW